MFQEWFFFMISCKIPFKIPFKLLFLYFFNIFLIFCNLKKVESNSLVTVWNALGLSQQTTVSLNYSQSTKPKDQSVKFWELAILKNSIFLSRPFSIFFSKKIFFLLHLNENKQPVRSYEVSSISAIWMVSSESWKRLHLN